MIKRRPAPRMRTTLAVLCLLAASSFPACRSEPSGASASPPGAATGAVAAVPTERTPAPVTRVRLGRVDALVTASGSVIAPRLTDLGPEVAGRLSAVHFDVGDRVGAGAVVFRIDPTPFEIELQRARAGLTLARAEAAQALQEVDRMRSLAAQQIATPQQLDREVTRLAVAKARVEQELAAARSAEENLRRTVVTSPYDSNVVERQLHEGAIVGPGAVVLTVQERSGFAAELDVPAAAAPVAFGDPVLLIVEGAAAPASSTIAAVNARIDPETRTYRVRAALPGEAGTRAGAFVRAEIRPRTRDAAVVVERAAVLNRDGRAYLFRLEGGRARQIEINVGATGGRLVEITDGAEAGDVVVTGPIIERLADGAAIGQPASPESGALPAAPSPELP
ncbi:MAG: efflux RND transporter periplasmic adaptor subunit [Holophagales bacterium]|nr:efflux RND transporter periplasmic adaptor subunit [Holophagales bacterium]